MHIEHTNRKALSPTVQALVQEIEHELKDSLGREAYMASNSEWLTAVCHVIRNHLLDTWFASMRSEIYQQGRQVYYLSMEFLMGRTLSNALISIDLYDEMQAALTAMGLDIDALISEEREPGLGNGGLGRLSACFMDSLATQGYTAWGYGLRYRYGMFKQRVVKGQQIESADNWLEYGFPWEFARRHSRYKIEFGGRLDNTEQGPRWLADEEVLACAYDQIIPGYESPIANTLRLWEAQASSEINLDKFNHGDYSAAVKDKNLSENITRVLYPNDSTDNGRELRLKQEFFLVSATIQDILKRHWYIYHTFDNLAEKTAIHLNDTHPVLAIPELIRLLICQGLMSWDKAWAMAQAIFSYTNHTLMPEALETWPVALMNKVLPFHLHLIYSINDAFLKHVRDRFPNDEELIQRVSIIDEREERRVRMAWLAVIASHKVNGVSQLHSDLMQKELFADFARIFPTKFTNKTNGITPRRWLAVANKPLSSVFDHYIGTSWRKDLSQLATLKEYIDYPSFAEEIKLAKLTNKKRLTDYVANEFKLVLPTDALFDVQIKRIHEYKRQLLNVLHIITRYNRIIANPEYPWVPRVVIIAGKAASSYTTAKQIIHLINDIAEHINHDERIGDRLKVLFMPNYSVSLAQLIIPAADLSEQISLAGTEASGTGNMKLSLNGALTIGTLDGANIEIKEKVGDDNIFIFGNTAQQVAQLRQQGYRSRDYYEQDKELKQVLNQIGSGFFNPTEPSRYVTLFDNLVNFGDFYQLLADYRAYIDTQSAVDQVYQDANQWNSKVMNNIINMGDFSSDRTIREYANDIWSLTPVNR